jgi:predicted RNase H-like HicB family nuclease
VKYAVDIERAGEYFSAWVANLPGCIAKGVYASEVIQPIRTTISFHLEGLLEHGMEMPHPSCDVVYVELAA